MVVLLLEYVSALQTLQTSEVAAVDIETLPGVHCVHAAEPMLALNLPATQGVQGPPPGPVWPLLQLQLNSALLPFADSEFAGQSLHTVLPDSCAYVLGEHAKHDSDPKLDLYAPVGHTVQLPGEIIPHPMR